MVLELLQDMLINNHLIAAEHKAAVAIIKQIETDEIDERNEQLRLLLNPTQVKEKNLREKKIHSKFSDAQRHIRTNRRVRSGRTNDVDRS